jgi:hypothetical protein
MFLAKPRAVPVNIRRKRQQAFLSSLLRVQTFDDAFRWFTYGGCFVIAGFWKKKLTGSRG